MPKNPAPESMPDDWRPDPERAFEDHDPDLEPYASMTRDEIVAAMANASEAGDFARWEMLHEFMLDKCSARELEQINFANALGLYLVEKRGAFGAEQLAFISGLAGRTTRELFEDMPPAGPPELVN
jgi:hypothetical protein